MTTALGAPADPGRAHPSGTGQVRLADDGEPAPGAPGLRALVEAELGDVLAPCPPLGPAGPALHTRTYVLDPPFYGDADIGRVAVCTTVNEMAAARTDPAALTLSMTVEAGLPLRHLRQLAASVRTSAREAGVRVPAVDVRVVRPGEADQVYVHVTGVGRACPPSATENAPRPGDRIVLSAPLGGFGAHLLSARGFLGYESLVDGGFVPLNTLLREVFATVDEGAVRTARCLAQGGLAAALPALAAAAPRAVPRAAGAVGTAGVPGALGVRVTEADLPVRYETRMVLEGMGLESWQAPTAGCVCLVTAPEATDAVLRALRAHPYTQESTVIGEMVAADGTEGAAPDGTAGTAGPAGGAPAVGLVRSDGTTVPLRPAASPAARLL